MTDLRQAAQQALEALGYDNPAGRTATIAALKAALAEPSDPVAYDGWVLREVLFDNGEPVGHRAPDRHALQSDRMQIDPVTGNVSIGKPLAEPKTQHDVSGFGKD